MNSSVRRDVSVIVAWRSEIAAERHFPVYERRHEELSDVLHWDRRNAHRSRRCPEGIVVIIGAGELMRLVAVNGIVG